MSAVEHMIFTSQPPAKAVAYLVLVSVASLCLLSCDAAVVVQHSTQNERHAVQVNELRLSTLRPNEAGQVPILEYHNISTSEKLGPYEYPASEFRKDLEWLYAHNYRPINLTDYVRGWIDEPSGMSPVIITFDDALSGQFRYLANGTIDPNCAVGILNAMHKEHPDWISRATFFVLTNEDPKLPAPFSVPFEPGMPKQARWASLKMSYLVDNGYEVGNHTLHHSMKLRSMTNAAVEAEFAGGANGIHKYLPNYDVQALALPYGVYPTDAGLVIAGTTPTGNYHNICAMEAGWDPAPSPMSRYFRAYRIPRIIPGNKVLKPGATNTIRYWLAQLEKYPQDKFVSDGNPHTYTLPMNELRTMDISKLKSDHYEIKLYKGDSVVTYN
jgi:peptidoglycan/xylan/chitin deacetylase (PgdA/CDA1 family)